MLLSTVPSAQEMLLKIKNEKYFYNPPTSDKRINSKSNMLVLLQEIIENLTLILWVWTVVSWTLLTIRNLRYLLWFNDSFINFFFGDISRVFTLSFIQPELSTKSICNCISFWIKSIQFLFGHKFNRSLLLWSNRAVKTQKFNYNQ